MALTITDFNEAGIPDDRQARLVQIDFDSSYPTGGESLTPSDVNLDQIDAVFFDTSTHGYVFGYDKATEKVVVFGAGTAGGALDEEGDTTDLSAVSVRAFVVGL